MWLFFISLLQITWYFSSDFFKFICQRYLDNCSSSLFLQNSLSVVIVINICHHCKTQYQNTRLWLSGFDKGVHWKLSKPRQCRCLLRQEVSTNLILPPLPYCQSPKPCTSGSRPDHASYLPVQPGPALGCFPPPSPQLDLALLD